MNKKDTDIEMLYALYKHSFLHEKHLAIICDLNPDYVKGRLKKMTRAGLVKRVLLNGKAANYITKAGMEYAGLKTRSANPPTLGKFEHSLGFADVSTWLCIPHKCRDGSYKNFYQFGSIITERDFYAVREMKISGNKIDGTPIFKSSDSDIHAPDGFCRRSGGYVCFEYERTRKSSKALIKNNILANATRFVHQIWVFDSNAVGSLLNQIQSEVPSISMTIYDIRRVRAELTEYQATIPEQISEKTGVARRSLLGDMVEAVPLNKVPLLPEHENKITFEQRTPVHAKTSPEPVLTAPVTDTPSLHKVPELSTPVATPVKKLIKPVPVASHPEQSETPVQSEITAKYLGRSLFERR